MINWHECFMFHAVQQFSGISHGTYHLQNEIAKFLHITSMTTWELIINVVYSTSLNDIYIFEFTNLLHQIFRYLTTKNHYSLNEHSINLWKKAPLYRIGNTFQNKADFVWLSSSAYSITTCPLSHIYISF